jgi:hypothetical protein
VPPHDPQFVFGPGRLMAHGQGAQLPSIRTHVVPPQYDWPVGQLADVHTPLVQTCPIAHAVPHAPQLVSELS